MDGEEDDVYGGDDDDVERDEDDDWSNAWLLNPGVLFSSCGNVGRIVEKMKRTSYYKMKYLKEKLEL